MWPKWKKKKTSAKALSGIELEVGPRSGPYLLVEMDKCIYARVANIGSHPRLRCNSGYLRAAVDDTEFAGCEHGPDGLVGGAVQVAVLLPHLDKGGGGAGAGAI